MRVLLSLLAGGLIAAPGLSFAQEIQAQNVQAQEIPAPAGTTAAFAPLPVIEATAPAAEPASAKPAPAPVEGAAAPALDTPTAVAPVLVQAGGDNGVKQTIGTTLGGVVGGLAGAAAAGPVGKFAGGFVGKRLARGIFGGDDIPDVKTVPVDPAQVAANSAAAVATPAVAEAPATAPVRE
ncbi:MAG: hypothetical protein JNK30_07505 [Phenylobacterium sp.]|uniref:hypothetical protein n=1 Tax=Phenylobacterium sp. TaxID=1871053 RepID=UPI001A6309B3|nr:hypothetical protein [Phenylobacterium sp.]MBL8771214.1 hypothetical protein [Phenylobacterium sp.]